MTIKQIKLSCTTLIVILSSWSNVKADKESLSYPIVDTNQQYCYNETKSIPAPEQGEAFFGQDGNIEGNQPDYKDNGDGTVTDKVTGLMWQQDMGRKMTMAEAKKKVQELNLGGYNDWRIPNIKELYSLIEFNGSSHGERAGKKRFIDTHYFKQPLGGEGSDTSSREIDAQTWSSTIYKGLTMVTDSTCFGVNFVDGRIKGYGLINKRTGEANKMYFRFVRGNKQYGKNNFIDNGNGTISDLATGLMWQKADDGNTYTWKEALQYADDLKLAGYEDWHLPNAKELQSIVNYDRSPDYTNSPAIDPIFDCTKDNIAEGKIGWHYYWTSTTHLDGLIPASEACYLSFGHAWGRQPRTDELCDVHGAGAQRSDPKTGNKEDYPKYFGPQKDLQSVYNAVRCYRLINPNDLKIVTSTKADPDYKNQDKKNRQAQNGKKQNSKGPNFSFNPVFVQPSISTHKADWRFAFISDTHIGNCADGVMEAIVQNVIKNDVKVVLFCGDNINSGKSIDDSLFEAQLKEWKKKAQPLYDAGIKVLVIRGNHEADTTEAQNLWIESFGTDLNKELTYRNVTFVGLDCYEEGEEIVNMTWLKNKIKENKSNIIIPFGHEAIFSSYTFHPNVLDKHISQRDELWQLFTNNNINNYFCGHSHMYNHSTMSKDGKTLHQYVIGGGGGWLQPKKDSGNKNKESYDISLIEYKAEYGYELVNVSNNTLYPEWIKIASGTVQTPGKGNKGKASSNRTRSSQKVNTRAAKSPKGSMAETVTMRMTKQLDLSASQVKKVNEINNRYPSLFNRSANVSRAERKTMHDAYANELKTVLSSAQYSKWATQRRARRR